MKEKVIFKCRCKDVKPWVGYTEDWPLPCETCSVIERTILDAHSEEEIEELYKKNGLAR